MDQEGVRVRCPGCAHVQRVTLAVGQQLQCEVCQTKYFAPIVAPEEIESSGETDSFIVSNPIPGSTEMPSDLAKDSGGVEPRPDSPSSDVPREQTHSWLEMDVRAGQVVPTLHETDKTAAPNDGVSDEVGANRHQKGPQSGSAERKPEKRRRRTAPGKTLREKTVTGNPWPLVSTLSTVFILAAVVALAYYSLHRLADQGNDAGADPPSSDASRDQGDQGVVWAVATKSGQRVGDVQATIVRVAYGAVRAKDKRKQVITTDDDNLIAITIEVRNLGDRPRPFHNWYHHEFQDENGRALLPLLVDDAQRSYSLLTFDDVSQIEGQRLTDRIRPDGAARDTLVFLMPPEINRKTIKELRLSLPAAAVNASGSFHFRIPIGIVEGI